MPPKFNRRRAVFVLGKIDEILAREQMYLAHLAEKPRKTAVFRLITSQPF
jgi:hypothetical protein